MTSLINCWCPRWIQVLRNGEQFLFHMWHPSCFSCYKIGDKSWMWKGPDCIHNEQLNVYRIYTVEPLYRELWKFVFLYNTAGKRINRNCSPFRSTWIHPDFSGIHLARSLVLCVLFCRSLIVLLYIGLPFNGSYWYLTKISSTQPSTKASNGKLGLLSPQYWYKEDSFNPLTHIVLAMSWVIPLGVGQEYEVLVTTAMRIVRR
jgi:uncharacterized membrane protein YccF (DUF307 family)